MIEHNDLGQLGEPKPGGPVSDLARAGDPGQGYVRAAAVLAAGNVTSRVLGLVREIVKNQLFGITGLRSAFEVATIVPTTLFDLLIGGMVSSALVPVFSDYAGHERRNELWGVLSTVLSVAAVLLLLVVLVVELFAPQVAWLVGARNFDEPGLTAETIRLLRMATPAVLFLSLASIFTGVLFALKRFTMPAFISAIFNGTIVVVALLRPDHIDSLVWGLLLGAVLQIVLQLPALRDAHLRWRLDWRHPAIRRLLRLYAPIVAGLIVNQAAIVISYNLATRTGDNSVSYMRSATTLYQFPLGLVVTALSIATLPTLARQALNEVAAFQKTLAEGIRLVITLILPAAAGLFALAVPIVSLLFERGAFSYENTLTTALVLRVYLFGLPFAAVDQMLVFASYARKDTWRPALVGVVSILIYLGTAVALLQVLGLLSLMVADAVKHLVHTLLMLWLWRRHVGRLSGFQIGPAIVKSILAAAVTGTVAYVATVLAFPLQPATPLLQKLGLVAVGGIAGLLTYVAMVLLLDMSDAKALRHSLRRHRNGTGPKAV